MPMLEAVAVAMGVAAMVAPLAILRTLSTQWEWRGPAEPVD
jgi:hypothetical protein